MKINHRGISLAKIKRPDNTKYLQGCEVMGTFFYCLCKSKLLELKKKKNTLVENSKAEDMQIL